MTIRADETAGGMTMKRFHIIRAPSKPYRSGSDREAAWAVAHAFNGCALEDVIQAWALMEQARGSGTDPRGWVRFFCRPSTKRNGEVREVLARIADDDPLATELVRHLEHLKEIQGNRI